MTISARTPMGFSRKQCLSTKRSLTDSPQTDLESASPGSDELDIKTTAKEIVSQLPSGTRIVDMGASDSIKFEPYVRELRLVQLYRSETLMDARDVEQRNANGMRRPLVLIITHYAVQLLREMSVAEIPKELVDVRTVDDSPRHEADIVIIDTVHTTSEGFTGDPERMAVMMTRARVGTIIIGPGSKVKGALLASPRVPIDPKQNFVSKKNAAML
ncbi:hypothetical protein LCI18_007822 [Fusarium solani-melongenae]|uniref:Uncharacterized protein n=1 Tax=Fusarium solani subsp. cucurbitae TaxID=2747967 RepID=A0ACD3Z6Q6_FUSSC|nr:hypothetical protein LCI18_007822 [Fusarium solani-melongenae]